VNLKTGVLTTDFSDDSDGKESVSFTADTFLVLNPWDPRNPWFTQSSPSLRSSRLCGVNTNRQWRIFLGNGGGAGHA